MYDLDRIKKEFFEICESRGVYDRVPVEINSRLTRTLGRVTHTRDLRTNEITPIRVEFSKQFIETSSDKSIRETIIHEACHYILGFKTHVSHNHDKIFHQLANSFGISGDATTEVERTVERASKYEVICDSCGVIGGYSRMCATIRDIKNCSCRKCGNSNLTVRQNW